MIRRCDLVPQYKAYEEEILTSMQRVLGSGVYVLGQEGVSFEREFADYVGVQNAAGVANATDGLILSLKALGIGKGDEVITTPFTAIPTVSAIVASGATPVFVDIDPGSFLIDINKVKKNISKKTKAVMPVHLFGNMVDIRRLREIVGKKIAIIEDAAQAHGSKIGDKFAGAMGDLGVFSFYPTKNLGGYGDGGMITSNNKALIDKIKLLRSYGMVDKDHIDIPGVNSRLDEIQAAILKVKLKYLDQMNQKRNQIAQYYRAKLNKDFFEHQVIAENVYCNYHVFVTKFKKDRAKLMKYLDEAEIQTNVYYVMPLHLQKANKFLGGKKGDFPVAEKLCSSVIALPLYPELEMDKVEKIVERINNF